MADNEAGEAVEGDVPESAPVEQTPAEPAPEEEAPPPEPASEEQPAEEPPSEEPPSEEPPPEEPPSEEPPPEAPATEGAPPGGPEGEELPPGEQVMDRSASGVTVVKLTPLEEEQPENESPSVPSPKPSQSGMRSARASVSGLPEVKESKSGVRSARASVSELQPVKETPSGVHPPGEAPVEEEGAKASPSGVRTPKATPSAVEAQKTPSGAVAPEMEVIVDKSEIQLSSTESSEAPAGSVTKLSETSSSFHEPEDRLRPPDKAMEDVEKIASGMLEAAGFPTRYGEDVASLPALSVKSGTASVHFQAQNLPLSSSVSDVSGSPSMRLAKQFKPPQGSLGSRASKMTGLMSRTVLPGRRPSQESNILLRHMSSERRGSRAGSIISFRKSAPGDYLDRSAKAAKFMNTYRLESKRPFVPEMVNLILQAVMAQLEDVQYDPSLIPKRCIDMAGEIRNKVKLLGFDRYKIVVVVDIGEKNFQGVCSAFRFLWDCERDNYTYHTFENMFIYAAASVFGVYYD